MPTNNSLIPPYIQTNANSLSYGLGGEVPPEIALEEQALNRKQQIANLLLQRGMQAPQGQMAGRFYVPPSPVQGVAQLANVLAGVGLTSSNDEARKGLADKNRSMTADAIQAYIKNTSPKPVTQELEGPGAPVQKDLLEVDPYIQQVNATAQPSREWDQQTIIDQGKNGLGTIERTAEENAARQIQQERMSRGPGFFQEGPRPTTTVMQMPTEQDSHHAIVELLMSPIPAVRHAGQLLFQQEMQRTEHAAQREFLKEQKAGEQAFLGEQKELDRQNRLATTEAQLNQALMLGLITKEQKDQMLAMQAQANADRTANQQGQLDLQKQIAGQTASHNKAMEDIQRQQLNQGKVPAGYRTTANGNLEAIPGGPADTKLQGALNQDTAMLQNSIADMDRLAESANQILSHPGLAGVTGVRGAIPDIPGTDAADARALLNKLKSQVGFSVLQNMRNNSKTGGALGSVSDAEGKRLENNLASVESAQSLDQMKKELQGILAYTEQAKDRYREAFNMKHKGFEPPASAKPAPAPTNKQGWKLMQDKNGAKAYVSPDGKQFEEVP